MNIGIGAMIGYFGFAIAAVSFIGIAFVYLRGSSDKGTMESQKRSIEALTTELVIEKNKREALEFRVLKLENENAELRELVLHLPELERIEAKVDQALRLLGQVNG